MDKIEDAKKYVDELNLQVFRETEILIKNYEVVEKQFKDISINDIFEDIFDYDEEDHDYSFNVVVRKTKTAIYYEPLKEVQFIPSYDKEPIFFNNQSIYTFDKNKERPKLNKKLKYTFRSDIDEHHNLLFFPSNKSTIYIIK